MPGLPLHMRLHRAGGEWQSRRWDIFCRVIDNLGDAGVCWRLAADLAARGQRVRLFIDDATALAFMAPPAVQAAAGVDVCGWPSDAAPWKAGLTPGDVVVEAFGCDPPPRFVAAMAQQMPPPCWINLEYLSAEPYVERSHRLPSPQPGGLCKWFFYPGFTTRTGGLLREPGLLAARAAFERTAWLAALGIAHQGHERIVSLFCYDNPAIPALLDHLAHEPTLLLLTPGQAQRQVTTAPSGLRLHRLPWLTQNGFDELLWACDINFVRGEDSLVRALWAGVPFVWQAYPQHDGAHAAKLEALLGRLQLPPSLAAWWRAWNGLAPAPAPCGEAATGPATSQPMAWRGAVRSARAALLTQPDLVTQLLDFAALPGFATPR